MATKDEVSDWGRSWGWLFLWGIILIILGLLAISLSTLTTFISIIFLGAILFMGGVVTIIDSARFWERGWGSFFLHFLIGVLYIIVGLMLMINPVASAVSLTFILGILYLLLGVFRIIYSTGIGLVRRGWILFSGILSLVLGILILSSWPASSLFVIGLFIGIDLLVWGWTYMLIALTGRSLFQ